MRKKKDFDLFMKSCVIISIAIFFYLESFTQKPNWQNLDLRKDSAFGISTEKAYSELLKNKIPKEIIIAVIDMGVDTAHEDLRSVLWANQHEIPGNGTDDDHNGYVDDIQGWNFSELDSGKQDIALLAMKNKSFYDSLAYSVIPVTYLDGYRANRKALKECNELRARAVNLFNILTLNSAILDRMVQKIGKQNPSISDFENYKTNDESEKNISKLVIRFLALYHDFDEYKVNNIEKPIELLKFQLEHSLNFDEGRTDPKPTGTGDNDVTGPFLLLSEIEPGAYHGTSIAGVIAADRNNNIGIKGIADHVKIMSLRVISFFDGMSDRNLARAIRYAVDNGAKVINMSFARDYSVKKNVIDETIKYAMKKDVLIIKAAGNEGVDVDDETNYPNKIYDDKSGEANAWIEVGASGWKDDSTLACSFSNYGKKHVDVFAPGNHLLSCSPGSKYEDATGTSIAAPMVSGLAALIWEYYPMLTARQVKEIIMKSVVKRDILKDKCVSGGVVNAYNALQLAAAYKPPRNSHK